MTTADSAAREAAFVDVAALERDLRREVRGDVGFDTGSRALYATDASNYRRVPIGVVLPRTVNDIAKAVEVCARHGAPVLHRGGGTSLAGQCTNVAVVIDSSRWCNQVLGIDAQARTARVEPGVVLDDLQRAAKPHGLRFGPDPSTHDHNSLGGMIGNNSAGVHSVVAGKTVDNVEELEVLTYDGLHLHLGPTPEEELEAIIQAGGRKGELYRRLRALRDRYAPLIRERFPDIPRRVSGYNLDQLLPENGFHLARALVGTEGTCATVLRATLRLIPDPAAKVLLAIGFKDICHAADVIPRLLEFGPDGIEGIDQRLVANMRCKDLHTEDLQVLPDGDAWLLVEMGGESRAEAEEKARHVEEALRDNRHVQAMRMFTDPDEQRRLWSVRESGLGGTAFVPGQERDTWPGWEDSAVHPDRLGAYMRDLFALYSRYGYHGAMYGHFGDGLIHTRIDFNLHTEEDVRRMRAFMWDAADLVTCHGGSLSGEHGDGQARSELLGRMFGPDLLEAFAEFKAIWDPANRMNPGDVVQPRPLDADLRLGPRFQQPDQDSWFSYAEEGGNFTRAALRCVGVGKCRRHGGGTMCPSYKATRDERHSTRGRSRLLQEMLQGDPIRDGWQSEAVHSALDLCLACKGCKSDCPVNVDMASYKAEFLAHHYKGKPRPRSAYTLGRIHRWARLFAPVPWAPNLGTRLPVFGRMSRALAGIHPDRPVPEFAAQTFRNGFAPTRRSNGPRVVLWTDSFCNHFEPGHLKAAAALLEAAGCRVEIPRRNLCCGRPLYDFGWLEAARNLLVECIEGLREPLDNGAYVVGVEPSCMATFRDELTNLFPEDEAAKRLTSRTMMLDTFLSEVVDWQPPRIAGRVLVHGHCYQKSVLGLAATRDLLSRTGAEVEIADSGCCGMAGAFGYETHKYEVSKAIFDQVWRPSIERAGPDTLIVSDGFSCRSQVEQLMGRRVYSLPELLADAVEA